MQFPITYQTFTIPNGAQRGTSRIVLNADGSLISYHYSAPGFGFFVAMYLGQLWLGPTDSDPTHPEADFGHAGEVQYAPNGFNPGTPPSLALISPTSDNFTETTSITLTPGDHVTSFGEIVLESQARVAGPILADNMDAGLVSVTTVANQWVHDDVTFNHQFAHPPIVVALGNNGLPAAGGTTALEYGCTSVTTTGFTLGTFRATALTMNIGWFAFDPLPVP